MDVRIYGNIKDLAGNNGHNSICFYVYILFLISFEKFPSNESQSMQMFVTHVVILMWIFAEIIYFIRNPR